MDVDFYKSHIETLCELKELAYKHNCNIAFGTDSTHNTDRYFYDFEDFFPEEIRNDLENNGTITEAVYNCDSIWFELYDRTTKRYHTMTYSEIDWNMWYEPFSSYETDMKKETLDWLYGTNMNKETIDWLEERASLYSDTSNEFWFFGDNYKKTSIQGFDGLEKPSVYRSGMALKFFGDLVCDYLGEPRIERVY